MIAQHIGSELDIYASADMRPERFRQDEIVPSAVLQDLPKTMPFSVRAPFIVISYAGPLLSKVCVPVHQQVLTNLFNCLAFFQRMRTATLSEP